MMFETSQDRSNQLKIGVKNAIAAEGQELLGGSGGKFENQRDLNRYFLHSETTLFSR